MDLYSHRLANALVGNDRAAATLEITLTGPELLFDDARVVAIAGAVFATELDGRAVPRDAPFAVRPGSRLRLGARSGGARAYLAVSGGLDVPPVFGSRSTHVASRMGGHEGRPLKRGDRVRLGVSGLSTARPAAGQQLVSGIEIAATATLRVLPGPHLDRFTNDALDVLQGQTYVVSRQANRMGYWLEAPAPLVHTRGADLISEAMAHGALQIPAAGQPVVLMSDRQTTGGYPCLATVITADLPLAAQVAPGDPVTFTVCTMADAMSALIARERALLAIEASA
jgi:antagonist of KipI